MLANAFDCLPLPKQRHWKMSHIGLYGVGQCVHWNEAHRVNKGDGPQEINREIIWICHTTQAYESDYTLNNYISHFNLKLKILSVWLSCA